MHDLKPIYICPTHGEVDGRIQTEIDCERDDVEQYRVCVHCGQSVNPKLTEEGFQCWRQMTQNEMFWEHLDGEGFESLFGS